MLILRYVLYFAFAFGALAFWALFVLGVVPFGEPACSLEPQGCSLTFWERLLNIVTAYGAMPVTALTFVFYRRWCAAVSVVTKRSIRHSQLGSAKTAFLPRPNLRRSAAFFLIVQGADFQR